MFLMMLQDAANAITGTDLITAARYLGAGMAMGFGAIGPSQNYAFISDAGKWFLSYNMLVGRLEMFSALVVFYPSFWKR